MNIYASICNRCTGKGTYWNGLIGRKAERVVKARDSLVAGIDLGTTNSAIAVRVHENVLSGVLMKS